MNVLQLIEEDEETVPVERETHPTGGRRITGKTTVSGEDPDQMRCHEPRVVSGDGKHPCVEKEAAPGDTTDTTEDAHRETPSDGFSLEKSRLLRSSVPDQIATTSGAHFKNEG